MRVAVTGATGNVGTSVLDALGRDDAVESIVGIARRVPSVRLPKVSWRPADVARDDLRPAFEGADCVIHLAWLIQPGRDLALLNAVNVAGSARVFHAAASAGVSSLVHASSVGAYSPGPKDRRVDESWPTEGIETAYYARQKAAVERLLDRFEREAPEVRVVRLRPALIFKREAASAIRRLFAGPLLPSPLVRLGLIALVPRVDRLAFQAVHSRDVGEAYRLAAVGEARGAFNVAAEPVLDTDALASALEARQAPLPASVLRAAADLSWRLRLQPTEPGWLDMARAVPLMSTERARAELGWTPTHRADQALLELLDGIHDGAAFPTPPLARGAGGPARSGELATGVGSRV
jgi:UDP-glucose 4-epimerase